MKQAIVTWTTEEARLRIGMVVELTGESFDASAFILGEGWPRSGQYKQTTETYELFGRTFLICHPAAWLRPNEDPDAGKVTDEDIRRFAKLLDNADIR